MHTARCPRCGYHLRGVMETWKDSCPLDGTCSECGLAFDWARVCCPGKFVPLWCIEYERGPRAWSGTAWRLILPWVFWRRLKISHPPRLHRAMLFAVVLPMLLVLLAYTGVQTSTAIIVHRRMTTQFADEMQVAMRQQPGVVQHWQRMLDLYDAMQRGESLNEVSETDENMFSMWLERLYGHHFSTFVEQVERGELDETLLVQAVREFFQSGLNEAAAPIATEMPMSVWHAIFEAMFRPLARQSGGLYHPDGSPYPPPADLHTVLANDPLIRLRFIGPRGLALPDVLIFLGSVAFGAVNVLNLVMPLTLLVLVQTRRRTRLHVRHLARITIYGWAAFMLAALFWALLCHGLAITRGGFRELQLHYLLLAIALGTVLFLWWYCALRFYARIPHAFWVTLIHLGISGLALTTLSAVPFLFALGF